MILVHANVDAEGRYSTKDAPDWLRLLKFP